jgi:hypothetical protein
MQPLPLPQTRRVVRDLTALRPPGDLGFRRWALTRTARDRQRERRTGQLLLAAAAALACWIGGLAVWLPPGPLQQDWSTGLPGLDNYALTWIGLDSLEMACLAACGWLLLRGSPETRTWALLGMPLFVLDAWFDVFTAVSRTDLTFALTLALLAELPMAGVLTWVAWKSAAFTPTGTPIPN